MKRALLFALVLGCAASRQQQKAECVYLAEAPFSERSPISETETFGPSRVISMHADDSTLVIRDRQLFRCGSP